MRSPLLRERKRVIQLWLNLDDSTSKAWLGHKEAVRPHLVLEEYWVARYHDNIWGVKVTHPASSRVWRTSHCPARISGRIVGAGRLRGWHARFVSVRLYKVIEYRSMRPGIFAFFTMHIS